MSQPEITKILKHTLSDYRLSRGERRALSGILQQLDVDERQLAVIRHQAFEIARDQTSDPEAKQLLSWLEDVAKVLLPQTTENETPDRAYFSPGEDCLRAIVNLLRRSSDTIDICVFTITDDRITDAIMQAKKAGTKIRILTDNDKAEDRGSDVGRLERAGIQVRVDKTDNHMHHKYALFDSKALLTGSYNWTRSAERYNEENIVVSHDRGLVQAFAKQFEKLWDDLK